MHPVRANLLEAQEVAASRVHSFRFFFQEKFQVFSHRVVGATGKSRMPPLENPLVVQDVEGLFGVGRSLNLADELLFVTQLDEFDEAGGALGPGSGDKWPGGEEWGGDDNAAVAEDWPGRPSSSPSPEALWPPEVA